MGFRVASQPFQARRPFLRCTAWLAFAVIAISWSVPSKTTSAGLVDINGGLSWGGWTLRGNSRDVGIWAKGSTTRDYDLYTTVFSFSDNQITGNPVQVKAAVAPSGFAPGTFSAGAFANGNTILGIGLNMNDLFASAIGETFLNFAIGSNNYQAASSLGGIDGRTDNSVWAHTGDFGMWMYGPSSSFLGPSNLYAMTSNGTAQGGTGELSNLPGGIGSGVSYDYAARMFRQGGAGGSIQLFFDLTAMETLYGTGSPSLEHGWNPTPSARIGSMGENLNLSMYNSDEGFVNASTVVIGPIVVPEPSTTVLGLIAIGTFAFAASRRKRKVSIAH